MTTIDMNATLGSVVRDHPALAREFERRGIDYCCHGQQSVWDACHNADLDPNIVIAELEAAARTSTPEPWAEFAPAELVDHIEAVHHRYLWDEMPRLDALYEKVRDVHGERHPELVTGASVFAMVRADLEPHMQKEEVVLFPMIRQLAVAEQAPEFHCGRISNPITMMMMEHERTGALLVELRAAADDYRIPGDACASYRALYEGLAQMEADVHLHIHKENNLLFPAVVELEAKLRAGS